MKVVLISNLNLETIAEKLHSSPGLTKEQAQPIADEFNKDVTDNDTYYATIKEDDYVLWRGMADLVGEPDENSPDIQGFDSFPEE